MRRQHHGHGSKSRGYKRTADEEMISLLRTVAKLGRLHRSKGSSLRDVISAIDAEEGTATISALKKGYLRVDPDSHNIYLTAAGRHKIVSKRRAKSYRKRTRGYASR